MDQVLSKKQIKKFFKGARRGKDIIVMLESVQYARNVASIFRTADAAGVKEIILTGISQKPPFGKELRKTSRNKEKSIHWEYYDTSLQAIKRLKKDGYYIVCIELTNDSEDISRLSYIISDKERVCFIFGNEVHGMSNKTIQEAHKSVSLPMYGRGASLNVSTTAGIVLYSF